MDQFINGNQQNQITAGKHHVSKSYIPIIALRNLRAAILLVFIAGLQMLGSLGDILALAGMVEMMPLFIALGFIAIMGLIVLIAFLSYYRLTWEITDEELHIYSGILIKKKSHIPFRRIHSVDINAKILDRLFGVVTVKLDTAAGSARSADAKIPALHLSTAELLRKDIFFRKSMIENGVNVEGQTVSGGGNIFTEVNMENERLRGFLAGDSQEMTPQAEYRLTNKELVFFGLTNGKAFAFIIIVIMFGMELFEIFSQIDENIADTAGNALRSLTSGGPFILIGLFIIVLISSMVISFVTRTLTYGNFVVCRYQGRLEVSSGLVQKKSIGVAVERIQTLKINQGLLQRMLGYAEISLETASGMGKTAQNDQEKMLGIMIHPFIKTKRINEFMEIMLGEFNDRPEKPQGLPPVAMRRSILRYGLWTLLLLLVPVHAAWYLIRTEGLSESIMSAPTSSINEIAIISTIVFFVLMLLAGFGAWKGRGYARNDRYLLIRRGILGRQLCFIPKKKIQYALVAQNPFQKRVRLVSIKANTAANGSSTETIKDVSEALGDEYLDWIEQRS